MSSVCRSVSARTSASPAARWTSAAFSGLPRRPKARASSARSGPTTAAAAARGSANHGFSSTGAHSAVTMRHRLRSRAAGLAASPPGRSRSSAPGDSRRPRTSRPRTAARVEVSLDQLHAGAHRVRREPRATLGEAFEAGVDADDVRDTRLGKRQRQSRAPAAGVEHRAGSRDGGDDLRDSKRRHVLKARLRHRHDTGGGGERSPAGAGASWSLVECRAERVHEGDRGRRRRAPPPSSRIRPWGDQGTMQRSDVQASALERSSAAMSCSVFSSSKPPCSRARMRPERSTSRTPIVSVPGSPSSRTAFPTSV